MNQTLTPTARATAPRWSQKQIRIAVELRRSFDNGPVLGSDDYNLQLVTDQVGALARGMGNGCAKQRLLSMAAFTMRWSIGSGDGLCWDLAWMRVRSERARQGALLASGRITFNCASHIVDPRRKLRVLVEEIGEVAEALDLLEQKRPTAAEAREHLETELIHVAAVCVAWLESLEVA